ncbi:hypothetical protein ACWCOT_35600 [Nonomuraea bangladeshensis]
MRLDLVQQERMQVSGDTWITAEAANLTNRELAQANFLRVSEKENSYTEFLRSRGAVDPGESAIKLVLRGIRPEGVRITGMRAITECGPPLRGTLFYSPPASEEESPNLGFDLDEPAPKAQRITREGGWKKDYFAHRTINLAQDETIALRLETITRKHYCEYTIQMQVTTAAGVITQVIDNAGRPFAISAVLRKSTEGGIAFEAYQQLYVGGVADPSGNSDWKLWDATKWEGVYDFD